MINTKFSDFLRHGGNGTASLASSPSGGMRLQLALKADVPRYRALKATFEANLQRADLINRTLVLRFSAASFTPPLIDADLTDVRGDMDAALLEWEQRIGSLWRQWETHPDRFTERRRAMKLTLIASFAGLINERRQRALGIDQYVWRSKDDAKVRHSHGKYDDQVFDWDSPPEGGHPGQAYNCRCFAEPLVLDVPEYVPDTGPEYWLGRVAAELEGLGDALFDAGAGVLGAIAGLPEQYRRYRRLKILLEKESLGDLTQREAQELAAMRTAVESAIDATKQALRDSPELLKAFGAYALAVERRPAMLDQAYRQGLATQTQVRNAFNERAYFETLVLLNVVPIKLITSVLGRRGGKGATNDPAKALLEQAARAGRHPAEVDWDVIDNPGIGWGGPINAQGGPWEEALAAQGQLGIWIEERARNFRTFDFFDEVDGVATSAKTLDTLARTYADRPSRIYARLKGYVDQIDRFDGAERKSFDLLPDMIVERRLELAVPFGTTQEQVVQILRAIDYAENLDIEVNVRFIR